MVFYWVRESKGYLYGVEIGGESESRVGSLRGDV